MKSLRSKLFVSVGVILVIVAVLNYGFSYFWIKKELRKASFALNQHLEKIQEQVREFSSFIMTYKIIEGAAELDGVSKMVASQNRLESSPWEYAGRIASYNPQISFVQVGSQAEGFVVVAPESARLYAPKWAPFEQGMLWIELPELRQQFVAIPSKVQDKDFYLLYNIESLKSLPVQVDERLKFAAENVGRLESAPFNAFTNPPVVFSWHDPAKTIFDALICAESRWVQKLDLINALATQRGKGGYVPAGLLQIDADRQQGVCVLSEEVFSTTPIIKTFSVDGSAVPIILLRKDRIGTDLDMARIFPMKNREPGWMALGFSLSTLIKEIAIVSERTMIATWEGHPLGFTKEGKEFDPQKEGFPLDELRSACLVWEGETYVPLPIDLQEVQLTALIPEDQALAATQFLESLGAEITIKITFSLLGAALISFLIALLLVNRISRKITGPITLLSHAAEDLGKGKYEGLVLPQLKKRHDEVEVLSHSFEKMVVALRDRDKIRGVLNKVVSKEITEEILKSNVELGGEERTLTLLFSDIRGFTHFSETLEPKELIGLLNEYMTRMCRIIDETHGVVDKFVGDEIMALYGAPVALVDHPEKAVEAAVHMIKDLKAWNEERRARRKITFEIGIGIHTGIACTGNMGAENRLNYTAIGANVNLASRLCGAAAPMQILISEETYKQIQEKFRCKALPPISLKGIDHPVSVYEIMAE